MKVSHEKFQKRKQEGERFYKSIGKVRCPYLKSDIVFNAKGLEHLKFKARNKARSQIDQYIRFRCISLVPRIIKLSHTLQGYSETSEVVQIKKNKRWESVVKPVRYFEFIAVLRKQRVRVIVKQVDGGQYYFWSVIPFWKRDILNKKRTMHYGNPAED